MTEPAADHPVIDADGHWLEPVPVFLDFLRDEGAQHVDAYRASAAQRESWYGMTDEERMARRISRRSWWGEPADTRDRATVMLPGLLNERLEEIGIDFALVYPTLGISLRVQPDEGFRRASVRALNRMTAELFAPYSHRMAPAAAIPTHTPEEAIDELRFVVGELGMKSIMASGLVTRTVEHSGVTDRYVDMLGLDSSHDYDPLWAACQELGVVFTDHGGSLDWADRRSPNNYTYNHLGHFAAAQHASCRAIFLGGVTRRFPDLRFAFLEGGVGWACNLLLDLMGHWEKRNPKALDRNLRPTNLDRDELARLYRTYGTDQLADRFDDIYGCISSVSVFHDPDGLVAREVDAVDDFGKCGFESADDLAAEFRRAFAFGCEADDKMTALAFDERVGADLRPLFSSDVGHWDVTNIGEVVEEARELVDDGLITEADYRRFTFANIAELLTDMNPTYFDGTAVEAEVRALRSEHAVG